jgi:hypothetical protein
VLTDADAQLAKFAASHHAVFTAADARDAGLSDSQIHRRSMGYWQSIHDGVFRMPGAPETWHGLLRAACLSIPDLAAISFRSGAALYDAPFADHRLVELVCRRWERTTQSGILVHESTRLTEEDVTERDGILVVTPERLVLDLARMYPHPNAVEKVIQGLRRKRLITYDSMHETFERLRRRGLPGVKATRLALERWDPKSKPTHSDMETWLTQCLREHGISGLVTQFVVLDEFGNFVAQTDGALPQWRITIEYQSMQEHLDEFQAANDDRRRNRITAAGYRPLHARFNDLKSGGHELVDEIRRTARQLA